MYITKIKEISLSNKYAKWYFAIIENAQSRLLSTIKTHRRAEAKQLLGYIESHHIYPRCLCNDQEAIDDKNIAHLTFREHFVCHLLMCKMFQGELKYKMQHAFSMFLLTSKSHKRNLTSRDFDTIKQQVSEARAECASRRFKGVKKTQDHIQNMKNSWEHRILNYVATDAHKKNLSLAGKGRIVSEETRKKLSIINTGRTMTEEQKNKISKSRIESGSFKGENNPNYGGKCQTEDVKLKMRKPKKDSSKMGRWERTPEIIQNMSNARKGKGRGERNSMALAENRAKVSASKLGRRACINLVTGTKRLFFPDNIPEGYVLKSTLQQ